MTASRSVLRMQRMIPDGQLPARTGCKIEGMTFARRLAAALMALVLAVFPLALERCRTACVTPVVETAPAAPAGARLPRRLTGR